MWSFFSRDPTKDFGYEIGEPEAGMEEKSLWHLHRGKKKASGEEVSIFVFDLKNTNETQVQLAKASFKRIKTLRHPNLLTYLDGLETDKVLYIVTEAVVPLETHLRNSDEKPVQKELAVSWGLHQLVKGLSFLINDCNLIHNNVCMPSVFVDKAGEWKLGGVDYMVSATGGNYSPPVRILPLLEKYDPPEKSGSSAGKRGEKWSTDMWGLGCLIWEAFNGNLARTSALKTLGKIPKDLVPHYCELVGANPKSRPNPSKFLENCRAKGGYMGNKFIDTMLFLEEIQIKDQTEKTKFFNSLSPVLDTFPKAFCKHKILPQLVNAFEFGNAGSAVLAPLFKLGKLLDAEEYQRKVIPCVVKLFSSTDRATRVKLLQQVEHFVEHLSPDVVNKQIFPSVVQGFMDTNPVVREQTIKAMLHLAAKLNYKNLNEELLKHFARLQSKDDQGGIRCNTTVCLGKIACHLDPQMRQKVLVSAYMRALKDPFPPARQAGILAMGASHNFFTLKDGANRLLPALCGSTLDPDKGVRDQAFKAIKCFLGKLEKVSEEPELQEEMEKDVNIGGGGSLASSAAGWAGWAVTGMASVTSKLYKGKSGSPAREQTTASAVSPAPSGGATTKQAPAAAAPASPPKTQPEPPEEEEQEDEGGWDDTGGWDTEGWGSMEDTNTANEERVGSTAASMDEDEDGGGWNDDNWASIEDTGPSGQEETNAWGSDFTPVDDQGVNTASSYDWGHGQSDDFFSSSMSGDKKKPAASRSGGSSSSSLSGSRPSSAKSSTAASKKPSQPTSTASSRSTAAKKTETSGGGGWDDSGWDDTGGWGGDEWGGESTGNSGLSKAELAKKQREEKRAQRQKELQEKRAARQAGGGAMKLGAKKLAQD